MTTLAPFWCSLLLLVLAIQLSQASFSTQEQSILPFINAQRVKRGLTEVEWDENLIERLQQLVGRCPQTNFNKTDLFIVRGAASLSIAELLSVHQISVGSPSNNKVGCSSAICEKDKLVSCAFGSGDKKLAQRSDCFTATEYIGCYYSDYDNSDFALDGYQSFAEDADAVFELTADACACRCGEFGFQYSARTNVFDCYCGDSVDENRPTDPSACEPCIDDDTQFCGGFDRSWASIYKTSVGCNPPCSGTQTCSALTDPDTSSPFYWCTPSCDFTVTVDAPSPCGNTALVTINAIGGSTYNTKFSYRADGGAWTTAPLNTPVTLPFPPGTSHTFDFKNILGCEQTINVTIPVSSIPNTNQSPQLVFDVATMKLRIMWYHLLFPSETGQVTLSNYIIEHAHNCANDASALTWTSVTADPSAEVINVPFEYNLQYHARVRSTNCVGVSGWSEITVAAAPESPYEPIIHSVTPRIPTTGGTITVYAENLLGTPRLLVDGVACATQTATASYMTCLLLEGSGSRSITIETNFNYGCQKLVSEPILVSYAAPIITTTSVLSNRGGVLTISGDNFGPVASPVVVTIDDIVCGNCHVSSSHSKIECTSCPAGTGALHSLVVSVASVQSDVNNFSYAVCSPICVFGACVNTNQCACDEGYGEADCSQVHICGASPAFTDTSACGDCAAGGVCCVLH